MRNATERHEALCKHTHPSSRISVEGRLSPRKSARAQIRWSQLQMIPQLLWRLLLLLLWLLLLLLCLLVWLLLLCWLLWLLLWLLLCLLLWL